MEKFLPETDQVLRSAGWFPGRQVDTSSWRTELERHGYQMHVAAESFLSEFGGLVVEIAGPGISRARVPFELDPMLCRGEEDRFHDWSKTLGKSFFPIGEMDEGRYFLAIDQEGEVYLLVDWVARFGQVPEAFDRLILGIAAEPISDLE